MGTKVLGGGGHLWGIWNHKKDEPGRLGTDSEAPGVLTFSLGREHSYSPTASTCISCLRTRLEPCRPEVAEHSHVHAAFHQQPTGEGAEVAQFCHPSAGSFQGTLMAKPELHPVAAGVRTSLSAAFSYRSRCRPAVLLSAPLRSATCTRALVLGVAGELDPQQGP